MELIGKLKEKVDQAETREEKKKLLEAAGVALTDDELDKVAGGGPGDSQAVNIIKCGSILDRDGIEGILLSD